MPHITEKVSNTSPTSGGSLQLLLGKASTGVSRVTQSSLFFTNSNPSPVGEKPSAWSSAFRDVSTETGKQIDKNASFCNRANNI